MDYVYILREALIWIITIFWLYQIIVSVCSLVKLKEKPLKVNKNHRFMAIIRTQRRNSSRKPSRKPKKSRIRQKLI